MLQIVVELKKQFEELQARKVPRKLPDMLEESNKVASEAVAKISDREKLCTKVAEVISTIWEELLEDDTREKIKVNAQKAYQKITAVKAEMTKLSL